MKLLKITTLALIFCAFNQSQAQNTRRLTAAKANDYGIIYSLPNTIVDITLEAEITEYLPGEFYLYAKKYLNIDNPIITPSRSVKLLSATINTHGVANPDQSYLVTLRSGAAPFVDLTTDNIPLSLNIDASIPQAPEIPTAKAATPTPLETDAARQVITEEMLLSHSSAKRAELAAAQIYALRQSRTDLITGQSDQMPPDGKAMELIMNTIDAQEAALVAMFVGTTSTRTQVVTIPFTPVDANISNSIIARLSAQNGIVDPADLSGSPVYMSLKIDSRGELPTNEKGETLPFPKGGVAYCIPGTATISISWDGTKYADSKVKLAQLGIVYGMAPATFTDRKTPAYMKWDPATGALLETGPAKL